MIKRSKSNAWAGNSACSNNLWLFEQAEGVVFPKRLDPLAVSGSFQNQCPELRIRQVEMGERLGCWSWILWPRGGPQVAAGVDLLGAGLDQSCAQLPHWAQMSESSS